MTLAEFVVDVPASEFTELRRRVTDTRWPNKHFGEPWALGTDIEWMSAFAEQWAVHERSGWLERQNALPHIRGEVGGTPIHAIHIARGGFPLILTHGWPSSYLEYTPLIDLLPGFDLVIPSLPGYGFSERPAVCTMRDVAALWVELMSELGYDRFGAVGTDFGAGVSAWLGIDHASHIAGIHLSNVDVAPAPSVSLTPEEHEYEQALATWDLTERGYSSIQSTRPQTLAFGLTDSPVGMAAWILEKWRAWADTGGDIDSRFDRTFLLDLVTLYWITRTAGTSIRDYADNRAAGTGTMSPGMRVAVPTGIANFSHCFVDEGRMPRSWAERGYEVVRFTDMPRGGHFAAREEPELLAQDITEFFADHA